MRRLPIFLGCLLVSFCLAVPGWAQLTTLQSGASPKVAAAASYVGPGDLGIGSPKVFFSCSRAFTATYASANGNACDIQRNSDNATCTAKFASSGYVDQVSTPCAGQTLAQFCNATTCLIIKMYDHSGLNACGGTCDVTATQANAATFAFNCLNSLPCFRNPQHTGAYATANFTQAQPFTMSMVASRTGSFTSFVEPVGAGGNIANGWANSANTAMTFAGTVLQSSGSVSDSSFHAFQNIFNGASSDVTADNVATTGNAGTTDFSSTAIVIPRAGSNFDMMEVGMWGLAFSGTNKTNVNSNQHGTSGYNF